MAKLPNTIDIFFIESRYSNSSDKKQYRTAKSDVNKPVDVYICDPKKSEAYIKEMGRFRPAKFSLKSSLDVEAVRDRFMYDPIVSSYVPGWTDLPEAAIRINHDKAIKALTQMLESPEIAPIKG